MSTSIERGLKCTFNGTLGLKKDVCLRFRVLSRVLIGIDGNFFMATDGAFEKITAHSDVGGA